MPDENSVGSGDEGSEESVSLLSPADGENNESSSADTGGEENQLPAIFADKSYKFVDSWQEQLEGDEFADLRKTAANYNSLPGLIRGLKDAKTALHEKTDGLVKIPGEDATEEEVSAYRNAMGIPESPDGYELIEGIELDDDVASLIRERAHGSNASQADLTAFLETQLEVEKMQVAKMEQEEKEYFAAQRTDLENAFGSQINEKFQLASRAAQTFGLDPEDPMFQHANVVKAFVEIGESISEAKLVSTESMKNSLSPESQADDIMTNDNNPDHEAYRKTDHPRHAEVVQKVRNLMKQAYPEDDRS